MQRLIELRCTGEIRPGIFSVGSSGRDIRRPREREVTLQRWLDLERANVLHALVRTRAPLTVTDEYQLLFLVRTSAKIMGEASLLLDEQRSRLLRCAR